MGRAGQRDGQNCGSGVGLPDYMLAVLMCCACHWLWLKEPTPTPVRLPSFALFGWLAYHPAPGSNCDVGKLPVSLGGQGQDYQLHNIIGGTLSCEVPGLGRLPAALDNAPCLDDETCSPLT